ncbi:hypothetical protein BVH52_07885 [Campylobacter upsaliensis]|nr:hypothetical protein [Campylobacter upsaliensis]EFU2515806.1 hypothetical protein [Campylobacter upsaliensis]
MPFGVNFPHHLAKFAVPLKASLLDPHTSLSQCQIHALTTAHESRRPHAALLDPAAPHKRH